MSNFEKDCEILSEEQMKNLKTRQLLAHLRQTYRWDNYDWKMADYSVRKAYRARVTAELATREHTPKKVESKKIQIARKKKGN